LLAYFSEFLLVLTCDTTGRSAGNLRLEIIMLRNSRTALPVLVFAFAALAGCGGSINSTPVPAAAPTSPSFTITQTAAQSAYVDYTGPVRPALTALRAGARYVSASQTWILDAQMAGPVFTGGPNFYVWGINRGGAGPAPFPDEPNVIFDSVATVTADPANGTTLTASVTILKPAGGPAMPASAVLLAPDTIELTIPLSSLPTDGFAITAYTWNLWPRSGVGGTPAAQIASFIPQNAEASFQQF
jgi:hypothetical protein